MKRKKIADLRVEEPMAAYESQVVEWKESWRDEYLKWICGFANAQGGKLIIGKNDKGDCVGLKDAKKLLADIPNKIRDVLGIIADINLKQELGKEYLEIAVEPYPSPVNYRGEYYYRTGSTKQELKGHALDSFLLKKYGLHWDGVPDPHLRITTFDDQIFRMFVKKGLKSGRLGPSAQDDTKEHLLANLKLIDGSYFKRAAALLFSDDPEMVAVGAYVKIGFFRTNIELLYQDEIHGNIFLQVDRTVDLLTTKYMKAYIRYEGIQRIDQLFAPQEALREAVTNAIVHKDYASGNPIQISVYEDRVIIWNAANIPEELPIERLLGKHPSIPNNPLLAAAFFRAGYIESWGRGIDKIKTECHMAHAHEPIIEYAFGGVQVTFTGEVPLARESSQPADPESTLKTPESTLKTPESTLKTPESTLKTPESTLKTPESTLKTPESTLKTPESTLKTPESTLKTPESTLKTPESTLKTPESTLKTPESTLKTPESTLKTPESTLKTPESTLKTPESTLKTPESTLKTPESTLKTPESTLKTPESTLKTPESTLKTPESTLKTPESTLKTPESTLKTPARILEIIGNDKTITIPEIAEKVRLTKWAINKQLSKLQGKGLIRRIGPDKGGYWEVVEKK